MGVGTGISVVICQWALDPLGCRSGTVISVKNDTRPPTLLQGVEISVTGDSFRFGDIAPGVRRTVRLQPRGESGVQIR